MFLHDFVQSGLVNWSDSIVDVIDNHFFDIDVEDFVTAIGEIGRNCLSDVPTPNDTDVHLPAIIQPSHLEESDKQLLVPY